MVHASVGAKGTRLERRRPGPSAVGPRRALTIVLIGLVPVAAVGPNLGQLGLRTEHCYAVLAALLLLLIHRGLPRLALRYWLVILAWAAVFLIALIGELLPATVPTYPPLHVVLGRFGVPILGLIIGAYVWSAEGPHGRYRRLSGLEILMLVLVGVACANAVVALVSVTGEVTWLATFRPDWIEESVGERAATGGRYGGVVNQPVEAGMLYSIALLTVARLWLTRVISMGWFAALAAAVGAGGALSGSKAFLFGGLPVVLAYVLFSTRLPLVRRSVGVGLAAASAVVAAWCLLSQFNPDGLARLRGLYLSHGTTSPLSTLSGGRLDSDGKTMDALMTVVGETGPFALRVPPTGAYDFGFIEYATLTGWVGVGAMALIAGVLLVTCHSHRAGGYWLALTWFVVAANLGGPAFTANRNALLVWVLFGAMLQLGRRRRARHTGVPAAAGDGMGALSLGADTAAAQRPGTPFTTVPVGTPRTTQALAPTTAPAPTRRPSSTAAVVPISTPVTRLHSPETAARGWTDT